ncbi:malto-oligosyltrehalose synthase [Actinocatenispora rupis]|uniref:Malto-oligosyltrehalose synthase n=1 Tax=Actinocatenispora rupis TaxID=519421 RepID=A0A8J3J9K1_9ACTN|nr:malto-oligosyltrehalose synthase [Actinocatenispora rupis]GID10743.1 malto-oligosyltrehalose synthase [Actinocatenispora rupis]
MTPRATYRVQVRPDFDFDATAGLADYLAALGVSHLYSAPELQATPGSAHGYDVVDHSHPNDELGGEDGRRRLVSALRAHGLGLVVDIVPNHMGVAVPAVNRAWWDVLRLGRRSAYADWFDVDWEHGGGRLVLPVLGDEDEPELSIVDNELRYHEHRFPIAPGTASGTPAEVHDRQHYRLVSWRRSGELNYRRFFAVSDLAGLRVEDPSVRDATHAEILRWYAAGDVDGIRVDHPDGLRDPGSYLAWLAGAAPGAWLVVEKILARGEALPDWPVAGTTGYDALAEVTGLFVDPAGEAALTTVDGPFAALAYEGKRDVATGMLSAELDRLVRLVPTDDPGPVRDALAELVACFPTYRSYLPGGVDDLRAAAAEAGRRRPDLAGTVDKLVPRLSTVDDELAARFQQVSGAVMAKGVEDTAFYRWTRFLVGNEVGCHPDPVAVTPEEFHAACRRRQQRHPAGMTTLSTHDTKRSEDVRARLAVLAELPDEWAAVRDRLTAEAPLADDAVAHLLWQTVVGAWPIDATRLHAVLTKSAREARTATSWDAPDRGFEDAMRAVVDRIHADARLTGTVAGFAARITPYGWANSLSAKLVQLTMPGVPDVYQGCELWDNSLVDPDNRRPVDFDLRRDLLARLDSGWLPPVDASGAAKLLVTSRALRLRRDRPDAFTSYSARTATGDAAEHAVAYDRGGAITVATRLPLGLARRGGWGRTTLDLPSGQWTDALTGRAWTGTVRLTHLLAAYPVALLTRD